MKNENAPLEEEVRSVYQRMVGVMLDFDELTDLEETIHPDFIGYGTAKHEFLKTREDLKKMAQMQKEQLEDQDFRYDRRVVSENVFAGGNACLILEEFQLFLRGNDHQLEVRLSTLLEKIDGKWLITHYHGSTPDSDIAEEEAFPEEGLRKKNEELEAKIRERTRELEIEAALERVRSRAMSMQTSEELSDLVITVFKELSGLDMVLTRCLIWIFNPGDDSAMAWMANSEDPDVADSYFVPYHDHPAYDSYLNGWKSRDPKWEYALEGDIKESWDEILVYGYFESLPEHIKQAMKEPRRVILSGSFNNFGVIQTASLEPLSEANLDILYRFSRVFEQSYTRFLDLKKAEAQAREAQIEAALERVRSRTMGMHHSDDLPGVIATLYEQLIAVGIDSWMCILALKNDETGGLDLLMSTQMDNFIPQRYEIPPLDHRIFREFQSGWDEGLTFKVIEYGGAEKREYDDLLLSQEVFAGVSSSLKERARASDRVCASVYYMKHGMIQAIGDSSLPEEKNEILIRFARAFEQTYTRFTDLKKAEAQAREAQIEAALERVRAATMAMHKTEDISGVAVVFLDQLKQLELNFIQAWIDVFHLEDGYIDIWFSPLEGVYEKPRHLQLPSALFEDTSIKSWRAGKRFSYVSLKSKEEVDALVAACDAGSGTDYFSHFQEILKLDRLEFVDANHKYGTVSKSSFEKATKEEEEILHRFAMVFEQTYTRFLDLQKAEAQAREAQIEAALEKVRSRTMAMQKSDELPDAANLLFKQVESLGIPAWSAGFCIWDKEKQNTTQWMSSEGVLQPPINIPMTEYPMFIRTVEACKRGDSVFIEEYGGKELEEHYDYLRTLPVVGAVLESIIQAGHELPRYQINHNVFFSHGYLLFITYEQVPEAQEIFQRFGSVFEQTYTRFLDLKKAEAQAREAQIEASLERVRSQTMAMHHSSDLEKSAGIVFEELEKLDLSIERSGIGIFDRNTRSCRLWTTTVSPKGEKELVTGTTSLTIHPMLTATFDAWEAQQPLSYTLEEEELKAYYEQISKSEFILSDELLDKSASLPKEYYHYTPFGAGGLYFFSDVEPLASDIQIMRRFAEVFDMTYTRYEDLKKAEEQTREAQIEAALEKVRSRTMAMQHSDELPEAANVLFLEIQALGIPAWSCGYNILAADKKSATCIMSSEGAIQKPFKLRLKGETSFDQFGEFVRGEENFMVQELGGKALVEHYDFMKSFPDMQPIFEDIEQAGLSLPTYQINHLCKFSQGFLLFITYEPVPGAHDIFKRFTTVFEQTYTRFLDLKNMEAQARESRIETALERVRARALAMQEPEELKEVVQVLRREMGLLGVEELETSSIYINDEQADKAECWFAIKDLREEEKVMVTDHFALDLNDTWVGRQMLKFYTSDLEKVSIVMKGDQRKEWIDYCETRSKSLKGYYGEEIPDRSYHLYKFSDGAIGAATPGDLSEESWGLLKRAAAAFSLAYSRFKDLTQARLDLKRLKEEKKRAEDALKELQLTQQQLVHAEKMASLGELTAGIAHEIQNPLNFVNNFSDVSRELLEELLEEMEKGDTEEVDAIAKDVIQNLEKIVHHGKRADSIVKGMLQHSRSGDGKKELTDLNALADEYLRLAYHGLRAKDKSFNAHMETDFDEDIGKVHLVPQDIGRVLLNLITNAFHAVNERKQGEPEGFEPTVWVTTRKTNTGVELSVRDNGGGIPEAIREKIFQPFFTTKPTGEGTGLGLSMSYDIVTKGHGGQLTVKSETGEGTEFLIILPV